MNPRSQNRITTFFFLLLLNGLSAEAVEVRLLAELSTSSSVVRLGDIADLQEVPEADRRSLAAVALFPAPKTGLTRRVTSQEVRETLNLFGLATTGWHITGATHITGLEAVQAKDASLVEPVAHIREVPAVESNFPTVNYPVTLAKPFEARADVDVNAAVIDYATSLLLNYFKSKDRLETTWNVAPLFSNEQAAKVMRMERPEITGGQAPYLGRQVFNVRDAARPQQKAVFLKVDVTRNAEAVVARRKLEAGQTILSDDIEIREVNSQSYPLQALKTEEAAVGMEVTRVIPAGQIVQSTMLRRRLLTRKGELVTVYSVAAGLQVKTNARALADAALGDVILLQATDSPKRYQARVTGPQECMVFVDTPQVAAK